MTLLKPDICVIGAGSGGLSVAAAAAMFGVPVVLIEKGEMGGDCLNVGCVPSKALIAAGEHAQAIREAPAFGVTSGDQQTSMARVEAHIRHVIDAIAPNDSVERFTALGVQVIKGEGRFVGAATVQVGDTTVQARRFVIATGSRPGLPPIPGINEVNVHTNETIFSVARKIDHLIIIGGGPIGMEIAQAHRRLGTPVTVLEAGRVLGREDEEMARVVSSALAREGVVLREGVSIEKIEPKGTGVAVLLKGDGEAPGERVEGSHLLVAAGRKPTLDGLGLEAAGIKTARDGIVVNKGLRTSNRRVYAIGDCAGSGGGGLQFTHVANYHAGLVLRSALFRMPVKAEMMAIPRVTYTQPEIASVGLSEDEARKSHRKIRIARWPFAENDRAQAERKTEGHIKVIVAGNGRILGCSIAGASAGELITPWTLAIARKMKLSAMAGIVIPYPTLSEVSRRAAVSDLVAATSNPWVRRLLSFLRAFG